MTFVIIVILLPVAAYRLTRLITKDTFPPILWLRDCLVGGPRKPTMEEMYHENYPNDLEPGVSKLVPGMRGVWYLGPDGTVLVHRGKASWSPWWLAELLSCPWCASAYVSAGVTVWGACWSWYSWPVALLVWLYAWGVSAVVASKEWA